MPHKAWTSNGHYHVVCNHSASGGSFSMPTQAQLLQLVINKLVPGHLLWRHMLLNVNPKPNPKPNPTSNPKSIPTQNLKPNVVGDNIARANVISPISFMKGCIEDV